MTVTPSSHGGRKEPVAASIRVQDIGKNTGRGGSPAGRLEAAYQIILALHPEKNSAIELVGELLEDVIDELDPNFFGEGLSAHWPTHLGV